jgi:uncharacterized repeat protein (TIGR01451 family)
MKRFLFFLMTFFLMAGSYAQAPVLSVPQGNSFPSFAPFNLDLQFTTPAAPCNSKVRAEVWYTSSNTANSGGQVWVNAATYGTNQLFSSYPVSFNANNRVSTLQVATQSSSTNMIFIVQTKEGVFCNGTVLTFRAKLYFYDANGKLCDSSAVSNPTPITITATNNWAIQNDIVTDPLALCLGGPVRYRVRIDHPANIQGSYNLANPTVTYTVPLNAQILGVFNQSNNPVTFTLNGNSTAATFSINNMTLSTNQQSMVQDYFVLVRFPCANFSMFQNYGTTASYAGTNPCNTTSIQQALRNVNFERECCTTGTLGTITKTRGGSVGSNCPGGCQTSLYTITFDNGSQNTTYPTLTITDVLPTQINATIIITDVPTGSNCQIQFQLSSTPPGAWQNGPLLTGPQNNFSTSVSSLGTGTLLAVRWVYSNFPAFSIVSNGLRVSVNAGVPIGSVVANTANVFSQNPAINANVTDEFTAGDCSPFIIRQKRVLDANGACATSVLKVPGDVATYRMILRNSGVVPLINGTITDVLDNAFSYVPGSVRYYYGTQSCPPSSQFSPTLTLPGSAQPIGFPVPNGQTLNWNNVNIPDDCNGPTNYLVVEFQVSINNTAPPGPHPNQFSVAGNNFGGTNMSDIATVNVGDFLNIVPRMEVSCRGGAYVTDLRVKTGDPIRYRITLTNNGNIPVHSPSVFNVRPRSGDLNAGCAANCVQTARGSQFEVSSYTPFTVPGGFSSILSPNMNCNGIICAGGTVCANNPGVNNSIGFTSGSTTVLQPGQSMVFEIDGIAGAGTIGQIAYNDAGASGIRVDNNQMITAVCSNLPTITLDSIGCGGDCTCGSWEYTRWEFVTVTGGQPVWQSAYFNCGVPLTKDLLPGYTYPFYYKYNCNPEECDVQYQVSSDLPASAYSTSVTNGQLTIKFRAGWEYCGRHEFIVTPICGTDTCPPCRTYFNVLCKDTCAEFVNDRIYCDTLTGLPTYSFCIRNNSTFTANTIKIKLPAGVGVSNVVAPAGVTYNGITGGYMKFTYNAGLPGGGTDLCTFRFAFSSGVTPGQVVCLGLALHRGTVPAYPECCEDSLYQRCITIPDCSDPCADVLEPVMKCLSNGQYVIQFKVKNGGQLSEINQIKLQRTSPGAPAIVFTHNFSTPLLPGQTSGLITYTLPFSPLPGTLFCYRIIAYDLHVIAGELCVRDSCFGDRFCLRAPECRKDDKEGSGGGELRVQRPTNPEVAENNPSFQVYPNPNKGQMLVRYSLKQSERGQLELWDMKGNRIHTQPLASGDNRSLDLRLPQLSAGIYFLKIHVDNSTVYRERIVIIK